MWLAYADYNWCNKTYGDFNWSLCRLLMLFSLLTLLRVLFSSFLSTTECELHLFFSFFSFFSFSFLYFSDYCSLNQHTAIAKSKRSKIKFEVKFKVISFACAHKATMNNPNQMYIYDIFSFFFLFFMINREIFLYFFSVW